MRTLLGWTLALVSSALLGAALYQAVLTHPLPPGDPAAVLERVQADPLPGPTLYRTEVHTIVEPTPTVTVTDVVVVPPATTVTTQTVARSQPRRTERADDRKESAERESAQEDREHEDHEDGEHEESDD